MKIEKIPIDYFLECINNNITFSVSRFGDGEIICMFNPNYWKNPNGTTKYNYGDWIYTCGESLKKIIINNYDYYHCFNWADFKSDRFNEGPHRGIECFNFLEENNIDIVYEGDWQSYDITKITNSINKYKPVFIGGKHLSNIQYINNITNMELIEINDINAYNDKDIIINNIMNKFDNGSRMFCFSASIVGKIIIDELYPIIGDKCFLIDFGSLWDPYCGKLSRSNMRMNGFQKYQPFTKMKLI